MPAISHKTANELLDLYYLEMRQHLLELAAARDRIERAGGTADPRLAQLLAAAAAVLDTQPEHARRFQEALSVR